MKHDCSVEEPICHPHPHVHLFIINSFHFEVQISYALQVGQFTPPFYLPSFPDDHIAFIYFVSCRVNSRVLPPLDLIPLTPEHLLVGDSEQRRLLETHQLHLFRRFLPIPCPIFYSRAKSLPFLSTVMPPCLPSASWLHDAPGPKAG